MPPLLSAMLFTTGLLLVSTAAMEPRGYVCRVGTPWRDDEVLTELDSFLAAYAEQRELFGPRARRDPKGGVNYGGNGMFHSFALWFLVRRLRPSAVIESGVHKGATSWLLRRPSTAMLF